MADVLVTGGAGYIGSICVAQLIAEKHSVIVVDNLSTGALESLPSNVQFYKADIGDRSTVRQILSRCQVEIVFHFAAKALIPESVSNPGLFFDSNVASGISLLEELRRANVHKFIFSSSAAVYGNPESVPVAEDDRKEPLTSYGESKLMFERILDWYSRAYGWGVAAMRYFNASGAWGDLGEKHDPETHLIPRLLQAASGDIEAFEIFGTDYDTPDGTCLRDYVHVLDIADAHIRTMPLLESPGMMAFNIGTGKSHSIREVLETAERICGRRISIVSRARRKGDPAVLCASPEKLIQKVNWRPEHSDLNNIVQSAWNFHRKSRGCSSLGAGSMIPLMSQTVVQRDEVP
jgi:UDP-glucose 4-epimerase